MKLIRQVQLFYQEGRSNKVYEVDLCEVDQDRYVVNFRYGRRGTPLRDGTKTKSPVALDKAESIFEKLAESKRKKGYREQGEVSAAADSARVDDAKSAGAAKDVLLERLQGLPKDGEPPLERTIWRVGERRIVEAVPRLMELASQTSGQVADDARRRYCIAWALGRIGDGSAAPALETLTEDSDAGVRRIALHALLLCLGKESAAQWLEGGLQRLPDALRHAVVDGDEQAGHDALTAHLDGASRDEWAVVELLYMLDAKPVARAVVLRWLREAPFEPPAFQRLRHVLKAAELRLDTQVLALLSHRFELTRSKVNNDSPWGAYDYIDGDWVDIDSELKKAESRVAYPSKTRTYLRRRFVRLLRRQGELNDRAFIDLAVAMLLPYTDADARDTYFREWWDWEEDRTERVYYDRFSAYAPLNFLLYRHSPRYRPTSSGVGWCCKPNHRPGRPAPVVREEAFPKLWDAHPDGLIRLLSKSACAPVHEFAARVLAQHSDVVDGVELSVLLGWLGQPYEPTVALALESTRRRWNPEQPDLDLVVALLGAELDEAREQAETWIAATPQVFLADAGFLAAVVVHAKKSVRELGRRLLGDHALPPSVNREHVVARVLAGIMALGDGDPDAEAEQANDAGETLVLRFGPQMRALGLDVIRDLLLHPSIAVKLFGARLLLDHETPVEELPADFLTAMLDADSDELRGLGVQLLAQLPVARLAAQEDLVLAYCVASAAPVRAGARALLARVATEDPSFAAALTATLAVRLLRAERHEGLHRDVLAMVSEDLAGSLPSISRDLAWRLLRSSRSAAQSLGAKRFESLEPTDYSTRKLALLAAHPMVAVRERAWQYLAAAKDRTLHELDDVFVALDNEWDDGRQRGFDFFREHVPAELWTPQRLVSLCDSVREDVQRFGQDLIQRYFDSAHGVDYLLQLSQHPTASMQLFATHYLERFATGSPERLATLEPYFKTVLCQVNRGRVAKDRVLAFLLQEGLADRAAAAVVLPILHRISLTVARGDRSATLLALRELGAAYPDLESPLTVRAVRPWSRSVAGGVG